MGRGCLGCQVVHSRRRCSRQPERSRTLQKSPITDPTTTVSVTLNSHRNHRQDLSELLGKDSANLLTNYLNLTPTDATAESEQNEIVDEEVLDLEFLAEGYFDCQGEALEGCTTGQE